MIFHHIAEISRYMITIMIMIIITMIIIIMIAIMINKNIW